MKTFIGQPLEIQKDNIQFWKNSHRNKLIHDFHEKAEATDSGNFSGMAKNLKCLIVALPLGFQLNDRNPRCKGFSAGLFKINQEWICCLKLSKSLKVSTQLYLLLKMSLLTFCFSQNIRVRLNLPNLTLFLKAALFWGSRSLLRQSYDGG